MWTAQSINRRGFHEVTKRHRFLCTDNTGRGEEGPSPNSVFTSGNYRLAIPLNSERVHKVVTCTLPVITVQIEMTGIN